MPSGVDVPLKPCPDPCCSLNVAGLARLCCVPLQGCACKTAGALGATLRRCARRTRCAASSWRAATLARQQPIAGSAQVHRRHRHGSSAALPRLELQPTANAGALHWAGNSGQAGTAPLCAIVDHCRSHLGCERREGKHKAEIRDEREGSTVAERGI